MSEVPLYRVVNDAVEHAPLWRLRVTRKVDIRLSGKGNSTPHGARPVHLTSTMIKWIRTSRLSIKNSLSPQGRHYTGAA